MNELKVVLYFQTTRFRLSFTYGTTILFSEEGVHVVFFENK